MSDVSVDPIKPSRGRIKREQILRAFMDCVLDLGLERTSMGEVASRMGLDRTSIHYYFRTREELLRSAAEFISLSYNRRLREAVESFEGRRPLQLVEHLFGGGLHQPDLAQLIDEFALAGERSKAIHGIVSGMYQSMEKMVVEQIDALYPDAPSARRREVAYVLAQLSEGCSVFTSLGFAPDRLKVAHDLAVSLLDDLAQQSRADTRGSVVPLRLSRRKGVSL